MTTELFVGGVGLAGAVIVVVALLSGLVERSGLPQIGVLLGLGAVLGPAGLGLLEVTLQSPLLRVVATLGLTLVLFTDALSLDTGLLKRHRQLALLVLGPGTIVPALLIAAAGWWLLELHPAAAIVLGAALASTDPVLLRGLMRRPDLPAEVRQALKIETGLNDVVLLPLVLFALPFLATGPLPDLAGWGQLGLDLFVLGPGAGVLVGLAGILFLQFVRKQVGVRRDYESLYSLGIAFSAFAAAEALQGSGFLAVFAAGMVIASFDVELCDCFSEYGETTAELLLLFTFVLFGSSLIWTGLTVLDGKTALFALLALAARPLAMIVSLSRTGLARRHQAVIAWFGPRGLSSLLLVLLAVFVGTPGADRLFALCSLVVLVSVVVHGGSLMWFGRLDRHGPARTAPSVALPDTADLAAARVGDGTLPAARLAVVSSAAADPAIAPLEPTAGAATVELLDLNVPEPRATIADLARFEASGTPYQLLDARSPESWASSDQTLPGAIRLDPIMPVRAARRADLPREGWLIAFCT